MLTATDTHVIMGQATDAKGMDLAQESLLLLTVAYPSYNWHVVEQDGLLVIKELGLSAIFGPYGMAYPVAKIASASEFKRELLHFAGELLERAGLPRGVWTGQKPELEGASARFRRPWRQ